jgi:hypothetical protein
MKQSHPPSFVQATSQCDYHFTLAGHIHRRITGFYQLIVNCHLTKTFQLWKRYKPLEMSCKRVVEHFEPNLSVPIKKGFGWHMKNLHHWLKVNLFYFEQPWEFQVFRDFDLATILFPFFQLGVWERKVHWNKSKHNDSIVWVWLLGFSFLFVERGILFYFIYY